MSGHHKLNKNDSIVLKHNKREVLENEFWKVYNLQIIELVISQILKIKTGQPASNWTALAGGSHLKLSSAKMNEIWLNLIITR